MADSYDGSYSDKGVFDPSSIDPGDFEPRAFDASDFAAADGEVNAFIEPIAMEADPGELFAGDTGTLDPEARGALVDILRRRYLFADRNPKSWQALLTHQGVIESRLHDLYVNLVIDRGRGLAYKQQVRSAEIDNPILLKDDPFNRVETILLVQLRALRLRDFGDGEPRIDAEELESGALSYFNDAGDQAALQREVKAAVQRLGRDGFLVEESLGRHRVTPLVEIVLSVDRLAQIKQWLKQQGGPNGND